MSCCYRWGTRPCRRRSWRRTPGRRRRRSRRPSAACRPGSWARWAAWRRSSSRRWPASAVRPLPRELTGLPCRLMAAQKLWVEEIVMNRCQTHTCVVGALVWQWRCPSPFKPGSAARSLQDGHGLEPRHLWCLFQLVDGLQRSGRVVLRSGRSVNCAARSSAASLCTGAVLCQVPVLVRLNAVTEAHGSRHRAVLSMFCAARQGAWR